MIKYPPKSVFRPLRWAALVVLLFTAIGVFAQPEVPRSTNQLVNDFAGIMTSSQQAELTQMLNAYARETSTQIAVVTEASLEGQDAFERSFAIADAWGIGGSEDRDNGVLIYVARDDRKIYIQTGYGVEGFLNDAQAGRIIRNIMTPAFRQGDFYGGIAGAAQAIMKAGEGEYVADQVPEQRTSRGIPPFYIFLFIFIIFMLLNRFGNRNDDDDDDGGYWRGGNYDGHKRRRRGGGWFILPGGFGGGGGFGGFGGGGFGGGGAGGGW